MMTWAKFTSPMGPVWINLDECIRVMPAYADHRNAKTMITLSSGHEQAVEEDLETVAGVLCSRCRES